MATNISRIRAQIAKLEQQAELLKRDALKRVQQEIRAHGLTVEDLFGGGVAKAEKSRRSEASATRLAASSAKFADLQGNSWSGKGPKPRWLREAIEGGEPLESFLVQGDANAAALSVKKMRTVGAAKKSKLAAKYADSSGNSWSGRGSRPKWLREAVEAGAAIESFEVSSRAGAGKRRVASKPAAKKTTRTAAKKSGRQPDSGR